MCFRKKTVRDWGLEAGGWGGGGLEPGPELGEGAGAFAQRSFLLPWHHLRAGKAGLEASPSGASPQQRRDRCLHQKLSSALGGEERETQAWAEAGQERGPGS